MQIWLKFNIGHHYGTHMTRRSRMRAVIYPSVLLFFLCQINFYKLSKGNNGKRLVP